MSLRSLKNKRVILTGGSGGIGSLVAEELISAGSDLIIIDRVEPGFPNAAFIKGDLSTPDGIKAICSEISGLSPDILINLAGIQFFGPMEQQTQDHLVANYMINLIAPALLTQAVLPAMKSRKSGQIVNIGSILGSIAYPYFVTYSSSKAGLHGFSEALRREVSDFGINVTHISPRAVKTGLSNAAILQYAALTNMKLDEPSMVVRRIVSAIHKRRKNIFIGFPEALFVRVNAVLPGLIDSALVAQTSKVATLFS